MPIRKKPPSVRLADRPPLIKAAPISIIHPIGSVPLVGSRNASRTTLLIRPTFSPAKKNAFRRSKRPSDNTATRPPAPTYMASSSEPPAINPIRPASMIVAVTASPGPNSTVSSIASAADGKT